MTLKTILIIGDHEAGFAPHERLRDSIEHASAALGVVVNTRWIGNDDLLSRPHLVTEATGVVLAPRSTHTYRVLPVPTLQALRLVRERNVPFLATGDAHDLVLVEVARDVMGMRDAGSRFYDEEAGDPVVKELPRKWSITRRAGGLLDLVVRPDPVLAPFLEAARREEPADLSYGINLDYASALEEAGLRPSGVDAVTNRPYLFVYEPNRWHVTAAFLPQLASSPGRPHPLFLGTVAHAAGRVPPPAPPTSGGAEAS
jgi:CTP synthase